MRASRSNPARMAILILVASAHAVSAQPASLTRVVVLPFPVQAGMDSTAAQGLYDAFVSGMRSTPGVEIVSSKQAEGLLDGKTVQQVIGARDRLEVFATESGADFVVGGFLRPLEGGGVEVSTMVYSREERSVREVRHERYQDPGRVREGITDFGRTMSHPRNFSPSDTPLLYSMLIPGLGQLASDEPRHALLSAGLVVGAAVYGLTTPKADLFRIDFSDFSSVWNYTSGEYDYFVRNASVTEEEFFEVLNSERDHHLRAAGERRAAEVRKRRAGGLFAAAYLFNLVDTVLITRRTVDAEGFFLEVESFMEPGGGLKSPAAGLRLLLRIP